MFLRQDQTSDLRSPIRTGSDKKRNENARFVPPYSDLQQLSQDMDCSTIVTAGCRRLFWQGTYASPDKRRCGL